MHLNLHKINESMEGVFPQDPKKSMCDEPLRDAEEARNILNMIDKFIENKDMFTMQYNDYIDKIMSCTHYSYDDMDLYFITCNRDDFNDSGCCHEMDDYDNLCIMVHDGYYVYVGTFGAHGQYGTPNIQYVNSDGSTFADVDTVEDVKLLVKKLMQNKFH